MRLRRQAYPGCSGGQVPVEPAVVVEEVDPHGSGRLETSHSPARSRGSTSSSSRSVMPHSTCPSTSMPSTSSGSGNRCDVNGSIARAAGSARARAAGVSTPTISSCWSRQDVSAGIRPRKGCTRQPVAWVSRGESSATTSTDAGRRADFLLGLAQRRREQVGVAPLRLSAGQPELAAVEAAVVGASHEHDAQLAVAVAVDRDEDGGRAKRGAHRSSWRSRSSTDSRRRMTRAVSGPDQYSGRSRDAVVVRCHRERVGAGRRDGEQVAPAWRRERDIVDQDVTRLAVHPGHADDLVYGLVGARRRQRRVAGAVELGPRIVGHATVDRHPGSFGECVSRSRRGNSVTPARPTR